MTSYIKMGINLFWGFRRHRWNRDCATVDQISLVFSYLFTMYKSYPLFTVECQSVLQKPISARHLNTVYRDINAFQRLFLSLSWCNRLLLFTTDVGCHGHETCICTCTQGCHGYLIYEVQCIGRQAIHSLWRTVKKDKNWCFLKTITVENCANS